MANITKLIKRLFPNWRYFKVVAISRIVDWGIMAGVPLIFGIEYVWFGWALGLAADCAVEFFGHKYHSFADEPNGGIWQLLSEFLAYLGNRLGLGTLAAGGAWTTVSGEVGLMLVVHYAIFSILLWLIFQVQLNRLIFRFRSTVAYLRGRSTS
jgi:hypothetical protein